MAPSELDALARALRQAFPALPLLENEPMKRHTSFRIGGPAALFAEPRTEEELAALRRFLWEAGVSPWILGNGTNLLVDDAGVPGLVVHISEALGGIARTGERRVAAGAGAALGRLAVFCRDAGLSGLEFAHGIPGSLGGAVLMNAGAYGGELKDAARLVRFLDETGEVRETGDGGFAYRRSRFSDSGDIILGAVLELSPGDPAEIGGKMRLLQEKRAASQPLDRPSAGSAFRRPAAGYAAAMIDAAGLKGLRVGGAMVSEKHAGFIVNAGDATSADVRALVEQVRQAVERACGVRLEPEIKFW